MYLIVGLGNPSMQYAGTRHNIGFGVIDELAERMKISVDVRKHKALIGKGILGGEKVILAKPQTYMNLSGESVREIMDFYKLTSDDVLVIYDDVSLDTGQLRLRKKGSAGGHNGIKSIIAHMGGDEFLRIKVGVGNKPPRMDLADYVLGRFPREELDEVRQGIENAASAAEMILAEGMEKSMNCYNTRKK